MLPDRPQIIINSAEHTNVVRDSKFIGYCCPVTSKSNAVQKISEIEQLHKKATHVCWAYRVYENNQLLYYADDAGEPHGSAGLPILKALEGRALVNTICLVVRYFGGTKLGIGGLIRAYGATAGKVLDLAPKAIYIVQHIIRIECSLAKYNELVYYFHRYEEAAKPLFTEDRVLVTLKVEADKMVNLQADLRMIPDLQIFL